MIEIQGDSCHKWLTEKIKPYFLFDETKDYTTYKEQLREKYIELLGVKNIEKNACPLNVQIESEEQKDGYKQIRFVFESEKTRSCLVICLSLIRVRKSTL